MAARRATLAPVLLLLALSAFVAVESKASKSKQTPLETATQNSRTALNTAASAQKQADQLKTKAAAAVDAAATTETDEATAMATFETALAAFATAAGASGALDAPQQYAVQKAALYTKKNEAAKARLALATKFQLSATSLSALVDSSMSGATTGLASATTNLADANTAATAAAAAAAATPGAALAAAASAKYVEVAIAQVILSAWGDHSDIVTDLQTSSAAVVTAAGDEVTAATTDATAAQTAKDGADADLVSANSDVAAAQQAYDSAKTDYDNAKRLYDAAKSYTTAARASELDLLGRNRAAQLSLVSKNLDGAKSSRALVSAVTSDANKKRTSWQAKAAAIAGADPNALTEMSAIFAAAQQAV